MFTFCHCAGKDLAKKHCSIRKTCPCNEYPPKPHFYIVKLGFAGVYLFFLFLLRNIDCGYSLEPPHRVSTIYVLSKNEKRVNKQCLLNTPRRVIVYHNNYLSNIISSDMQMSKGCTSCRYDIKLFHQKQLRKIV